MIASQEFLVQKDQIIGAVVATKDTVKSVYVSVGHLISLGATVKITKHCVRNNKISEPIVQAHNIAAKEKYKVKRKRKTL
jgi:deoxyribonuclease V